MSTENVPSELRTIIEEASDFHGHLGPFLTVGVRMGLAGLDRMDLGPGEALRIVASLPLCVPFSCIIDGLQTTTKCTVGNQKLSLKDSQLVTAIFETSKVGKKVVITLKAHVLQELKQMLLTEGLANEEMRTVAWKIAALPQEELFIIT
ncbi:MAG: FmdE family protein [Candidatus Thorarchaeota archaeon]